MATSEPAPDAEAPAPEPQASGESADRLRRALASSLDGFWEYDLRREQAWYSDSLRRLLGYDDQTLPDGHGRLSGFLHPDDQAAYQAAVDTSFAGDTAFELEARLRDGQGRWRWVRCRGRFSAGDDGRPQLLAGSLTDVHEAHEARAALERMRERYERAILATPHGLFERWLDEDRMFIADRIWHALGYEPGELPSTRSALMGLLHPDDVSGYEATVAAAAEHGHLDVYLRFRSRGGAYRWFQQIASLHAEPGGRVLVTGVLIDVDDAMCARKTLEHDRAELERLVAERTVRLEAALAQAEQARAEAERATAAKSHFLAHMSHEIRTPLNGVLGLTELALQMATAPTQRRHLEVALQSGQALLQVVDEVLAFSRTQGEAESPADEPFDLTELLATTLRSVMPLARGRDVVVRFDVIGGRSRVRGDPGRLRQIVINLLGNALKFTERGHVGLVAEVVDGDDGRCRMTLRVEDTGPGIPTEQHERVFEPFVQVDQSLSRRYGGTGLGLATARAVARSMGGELAIASRVGEGTVFTLTLGLAAEGPLDPPIRPPARPVWLLAPDPRRVLWLDERLRRMGCATWLLDTPAAVVERAAAVLPRERPAALLLSQWSLTDAGMLHALRAALPTTSTVLLLRPDWHEPAIERTAEMLGMETAMLPLTPAALGRLVQRPADVPPSPDTVAAELAQADGKAPAAQPRRHVLLVEDNPVNRMIGEGFLHALGLATRTADDGAQALDACARETPALVLMDLQMPVMDGLEATRRLRSAQREGKLPPFPIVALTAHALQTDRDRAAEAGMDGYLTKPLLLEALRAELRRWLPALGEA